MIKAKNQSLLLIFDLLKAFFRLSPLAFLSAVFMSLLSQVAFLLALLLPLKVIMLLSTNSVPDSFPDFLQTIPYDRIVVGLGVISVLFYLVGNGAQKITDLVITSQSQELAKATPKFEIYENQIQLEKKLYAKFFELIAGLIFFIAGIIVLSALYIEVGLLLAVSVGVFLWRESSSYEKVKNGKDNAKRASFDIVFF